MKGNPANAVDPLGLLSTCDAHPEYCTGREVPLPVPKPPVPTPPEPLPPIVPPLWTNPDQPDPERCRDERCEQQYENDLAMCRAIGRTGNKKRAALCYQSALERKIACELGKPLPPLIIWNN